MWSHLRYKWAEKWCGAGPMGRTRVMNGQNGSLGLTWANHRRDPEWRIHMGPIWTQQDVSSGAQRRTYLCFNHFNWNGPDMFPEQYVDWLSYCLSGISQLLETFYGGLFSFMITSTINAICRALCPRAPLIGAWDPTDNLPVHPHFRCPCCNNTLLELKRKLSELRTSVRLLTDWPCPLGPLDFSESGKSWSKRAACRPLGWLSFKRQLLTEAPFLDPSKPTHNQLYVHFCCKLDILTWASMEIDGLSFGGGPQWSVEELHCTFTTRWESDQQAGCSPLVCLRNYKRNESIWSKQKCKITWALHENDLSQFESIFFFHVLWHLNI